MKISTADAIFSRAEGLELRDFRHEVRENIDKQFGHIKEEPILFAFAAIHGATEFRGRTVSSIVQRLEREADQNPRRRKSLERDYRNLSVGFGKAVDHLRESFSVLNQSFLYSENMLAVLAAFYFWNRCRNPTSTQKEQIRRWFWATAVGSRYSGRNFSRCLPADLKFFKRLAKNGNGRFDYQPEVDWTDVVRSQYASHSGITTAYYCLMLLRKPVSIRDNGLNLIPVSAYSTLANRKDRHHIFPTAVLAPLGVFARKYNSICNVCLLTAEENQSIGKRRPKSYIGEIRDTSSYFNRKMSRHLIPVDSLSGIWHDQPRKGFEQFVRQRAALICKEFERVAGMRLFRRERK